MVEQMTYPIKVHEVATKGQRIFRQLSEKLEKEHLGEAVAIEVDTKVAGMRGEVEIEAILDTGFNGQVCLPLSVAVPLGLELA